MDPVATADVAPNPNNVEPRSVVVTRAVSDRVPALATRTVFIACGDPVSGCAAVRADEEAVARLCAGVDRMTADVPSATAVAAAARDASSRGDLIVPTPT
jgi:hypothetical protein